MLPIALARGRELRETQEQYVSPGGYRLRQQAEEWPLSEPPKNHALRSVDVTHD